MSTEAGVLGGQQLNNQLQAMLQRHQTERDCLATAHQTESTILAEKHVAEGISLHVCQGREQQELWQRLFELQAKTQAELSKQQQHLLAASALSQSWFQANKPCSSVTHKGSE
ncbi:hypothetical protein ABBQ32_002570 [Trebouxia sp. C0010 RCD-2024]